MPKLAANLTLMFNEVPFLDRFEAAAKAGFKGVEYLFPYEFPKDQIAERLQKHRLTQVLFDLPAGNWAAGDRGIACDPARRGEFQDSVGSALDYANSLSCKRLTCLAGKAPVSMSAEEAAQILIENLRFAARQAATQGISVLLEAINTRDIPGFFVNRTAQSKSVLDAVDEPNARMQYDIYHMQVMEGDLASTIKANLDQISHFQLADNPGRNEPGTGEINYGYLLPYIDSLGYDGWVGCEYRPRGRTLDGLGWARKYLG
jgi:hydroxypyruvate isomerase